MPEILISLFQTRFLLSNIIESSLNPTMKADSICSYVCFCFSPSLVCKELLWADQSVSEHRVPLQHELLGGDHWLVRHHESKHQPKSSLSLSYIGGNLNQGENWHISGSKKWSLPVSSHFCCKILWDFCIFVANKDFYRWSSPDCFIAANNKLSPHFLLICKTDDDNEPCIHRFLCRVICFYRMSLIH